MIQDIYPHRFDNQFLEIKNISDDDFIFHFVDNFLLLKTKGEEFELPQRKDFPEFPDDVEGIFLFTLNDVPCFLIQEKQKVSKPEFVYEDINFFRTIKNRELAWASIVGLQLNTWYAQNNYCGRCGTATKHKTSERALVCPNCNLTVYPKVSPAVIVAIICKDKLLLAQGTNFRDGWYSLVAGYTDIGESLEETLVREVKEEVGLDIWNIRYYKSQPWPLSGSMMIAYIANADDKQPIKIDQNEIAHAAWYSRGNLPDHPTTISIAGEMIEMFERGEL